MRRVGWYATAMDAIETVCLRQKYLTSDEVWEELERVGGSCPGFAVYGDGEVEHAHGCCVRWSAKYDAPHPNAMGAVINAACQQRLIRPTGRIVHSNRPAAKHRNIQVHESRTFTGEAPTVEDFISQHLGQSDAPTLFANGGVQ